MTNTWKAVLFVTMGVVIGQAPHLQISKPAPLVPAVIDISPQDSDSLVYAKTMAASPAEILYGDINRDGRINIGDIFVIGQIVKNDEVVGDVNGDCEVDFDDINYLINYVFHEGPLPVRWCSIKSVDLP